MNIHVNSIETFLEALRKELEVPDHRYEQAERSYTSLGDWLHREASTVRQYDPQVYCQGSSASEPLSVRTPMPKSTMSTPSSSFVC